MAPDGAQAAGRRDQPLRILYSFPDTLGAPGIGVAARNHTHELARLGHEHSAREIEGLYRELVSR